MRLQSQQSVRNLNNQSAISVIRLQSSCIAVRLWRLQSPTRRWMTNCICKLRNFCSLIVEIAVGLWKLQLDCGDCSWIVEISVGLWRLQSDCWDCSLIAEIAVLNIALGAWHTLECGPLYVRHGKICSLIVNIAVWLWGLHYDCWYCSLIVEIAVWNSALGAWHTLECGPLYVRQVKSVHWLWILQSDCGDCTMIADFAVWLWRLQSETVRWVLDTLWNVDCEDCSLIVDIAVWLLRLQSDCWDCSLIAEIAVLNSAIGAWHTLECGPLYVRQGKICSLIVKIAVWLWRLQSDCWDCSLIAEIAVWLQLTVAVAVAVDLIV